MSVYNFLVHLHSGLRWLVLFSLILAIIHALVGKFGFDRRPPGRPRQIDRIALILVHIQVLTGIILYFTSPKVVFAASSMKYAIYRFFLVEHLVVMLAAVILITIGYVKSRKSGDSKRQFRIIMIYYSLGLLLILAAIPWPFLPYGGHWV